MNEQKEHADTDATHPNIHIRFRANSACFDLPSAHIKLRKSTFPT